jgi:hypothetical protein
MRFDGIVSNDDFGMSLLQSPLYAGEKDRTIYVHALIQTF